MNTKEYLREMDKINTAWEEFNLECREKRRKLVAMYVVENLKFQIGDIVKISNTDHHMIIDSWCIYSNDEYTTYEIEYAGRQVDKLTFKLADNGRVFRRQVERSLTKVVFSYEI